MCMPERMLCSSEVISARPEATIASIMIAVSTTVLRRYLNECPYICELLSVPGQPRVGFSLAHQLGAVKDNVDGVSLLAEGEPAVRRNSPIGGVMFLGGLL